MKTAIIALCLAGCGSPCDSFADQFCTFATACGSVLPHDSCILQVKEWMKENPSLSGDQNCETALQKLDTATCSSTFGSGRVAGPGFVPAR